MCHLCTSNDPAMPQEANRCMVLWLARPVCCKQLGCSGRMAELLARWCFHEQDVSGRDCGGCWQGCQQDGRRGPAQHGAALWAFTSLPGAAWHSDPRACPRNARAAAAHACAAAQGAFGRHSTLHGPDYCSRRASARSAIPCPGRMGVRYVIPAEVLMCMIWLLSYSLFLITRGLLRPAHNRQRPHHLGLPVKALRCWNDTIWAWLRRRWHKHTGWQLWDTQTGKHRR